MTRSSRAQLRAFVGRVRETMWVDLDAASRNAIKAPDPRCTGTWSMGMLDVAEQIREASALLQRPTRWKQLTYTVWPFYEAVEGVPLPDEAWEWLTGPRGNWEPDPATVAWVLAFRGAKL